jgi:hypothetical protein
LREREARKQSAEKIKKIRSSVSDGKNFDFQDFKPTSIQEQKIYADTISKRIDIEKDIELLIEKRIYVASIGAIGGAINSNFVLFGRGIADRVAQKLGLPGVVKIVEKIINEEMEKRLRNVIDKIEEELRKIR